MPLNPRRSARVVLPVLLCVISLVSAANAKGISATVPFIGCPADGQLGPLPAPKGRSQRLDLAPSIAAQLAWYEFNGDPGRIGVLAPRGWSCFATYGSSGISLYVAPESLDSAKVLAHKNWKGFKGAAVQLSESDGGTSGRFEVARLIARLFPAHRDFVRKVIAEGIEPASDFPTGPFPSDHLAYRSKELVEFTTPPTRAGLGTMSWLLPSGQPITGMALLRLNGDTDLLQLDVRLPPKSGNVAGVIVQETEHESAHWPE